MASLAVIFDDDPRGIEAARRVLKRLEKAFEAGGGDAPKAGGADGSSQPNPAVLLYNTVGKGTFTRRMLALLAVGTDGGLTPAEIATELEGEGKKAISKGSARAAILNARRVEKRLRDEGRIEKPVIVADFDNYELEGAGRYQLEDEDRAALAALAN